MLNFYDFFEDQISSSERRRIDRFYKKEMSYDFNMDIFSYLLAMQNSKKFIKLDDDIYCSLIGFLGHEGLKTAADYVKQHFRKHFKGDKQTATAISSKISKVINHKILFERWLGLYKLLVSRKWNSVVDEVLSINKVFCFLLEFAITSKELPQNEIFEKRLNLLCETLDIDDINRAFLRFFYFNNYNSLAGELYDCVCKAFGLSDIRINYDVVALFTNYPEEAFLEIVSGERGLINLGIVLQHERSNLDLPLEIKRYLKGLGSDNLIDIYASIDKNPPLAMEKFSCLKEAEFITELISMHKNERALHFLLHGIEGTGKTELARTIAANANCELLDIGRGFKKQLFEKDGGLMDNITRFRIRALSIAEIMFRNNTNLVLLVDEADVLLNHFEKGILNQILEDMRLPVIWISNSLRWVNRSTMRRFNYSIEFKANNPSMRLKLWKNVVEKHDAGHIFTEERMKELAEKYEIAPGAIELAVSNELLFVNNGKHEHVAELVLKQHSDLLGLRNNYKNMQSRAPKYDESVLNVQGMDNAIHAAKSYAELLRNKKTESNCTMLLYGAPGTGKTEFARYLARVSGLPFKEISYGKISSAYIGETEKNLAEAFEDASEEGALLFIDEADSLISDRQNAVRSWEITQVNEFLVQLESCKCLVVCSTNFQGKLDIASNRRFHFHLKFDYLKKEGILKMARNFFPDFEHEEWRELCNLECLTPGDFYAVHKRLQWLPREELSVDGITRELTEIVFAKEPYGNKVVGF